MSGTRPRRDVKSDIEKQTGWARGIRNSGSLLVIVLITLSTPLPAEYQAGLDAYNAGDYATALAEWKEEINRPGPPEVLAIYREALYGMAILYWKGQGVEQDYTISAVWLKQAADINHPEAQVKLGFLYTTGQGVPQNFEEATRWFRMAAEQGNEDAKHNLQVLEERGLIDVPITDAGVYALNPVAPGALQTAENRSDEGPAASPAIVSEAAPGSDFGEQWILGRDPEHYTIQVIALRQPEKLHDFIAAHVDWTPFAIYRQTRYEQPLWVLVQGEYADVDAARDAVSQFPPGLQKQGDLWIRRFKMVQGLIE